MHAGGGTKSNPVQSILVYFMCKRCNLIQNALKLLKGTISITPPTLNNVTGPVFRLSVCKHVYTPAYFLY